MADLHRWRSLTQQGLPNANSPSSSSTSVPIKIQPRPYETRKSKHPPSKLSKPSETPLSARRAQTFQHLSHELLNAFAHRQKDQIRSVMRKTDPGSQLEKAFLQQRKSVQVRMDPTERTNVVGSSGVTTDVKLQEASRESKRATSLLSLLETFDVLHHPSASSEELDDQDSNNDENEKEEPLSFVHNLSTSVIDSMQSLTFDETPGPSTARAFNFTSPMARPFAVDTDQSALICSASGHSRLLLELQHYVVHEERLGTPPLQIYSHVFERLITEFKQYGPLLAQIKHAYDLTIKHCHSEADQVRFLRSKIQKLMAQNENRKLLHHERQKALRLEREATGLADENLKLKEEMKRKLEMYANYLPAYKRAELRQHLNLDPNEEVKPGQDPITLLENKMHSLQQEVHQKELDMKEVLKRQQDEFVPISVRAELLETLEKAEHHLLELRQTNAKILEEKAAKQLVIQQLEDRLQEKSLAYDYLMQEYHELSEAMASNLKKSTTSS